jgi:hypothetical protein
MEQTIYQDDGIAIRSVNGKFFIKYDAGAHQIEIREDEITTQQKDAIVQDPSIAEVVLFEIQKRLIAEGVDPYTSNI